jgi:hypothetical protein
VDKAKIETRVLNLIERVKAGGPQEDTITELKSEFPEEKDGARLIAAHANAAHGEPLLWVIGLCQQRGVVPFCEVDLAKWWPAVRAEFDQQAPEIERLNVLHADGPVVALVISTDRAPYVIKNPAYGSQGGGPISFEVPYREGETTRTARRSDLLKILTPYSALPKVELLGASLGLTANTKLEQGRHWYTLEARADLYLEPLDDRRLVIPLHRCFAHCEVPLGSSPVLKSLMAAYVSSRTIDTETISMTATEIIVTGPGLLEVGASFPVEAKMDGSNQSASLLFEMLPSRCTVPSVVSGALHLKKNSYYLTYWACGRELASDHVPLVVI